MPGGKYTNQLIHESSPYLLQHAHNPVEWHAWNASTLAKAKSLDKLLLISIGYSACHWCHVMEKESFEDKEVARLMNRQFICIKVDREERPDIDQVYMNAVQLITGSGGWPLNCFALSDGRPFFGGTYFRKNQWMQLLENIALLYSSRRKELEAQAESLTSDIKNSEIIKIEQSTITTLNDLRSVATRLEKQFDLKEGGLEGAPKFPMPVTVLFLLRYGHHSGDENIINYVKLTLRKMAYGGIYDQIGGGFARYSTDAQWKVPHFEKMLYDNAQLISLYSEAWKSFGDNLYKEVASDTFKFISTELTEPGGGFYASLDADSEGEEGKFYTWDAAEISLVLGKQADLIKKYYQVGKKGSWEKGQNILLHDISPVEFAREQGLQPSAFKTILNPARAKLLKARNKRIRPLRDYKVLASWNGMMLKGLADAWIAFGKQEYLIAAKKNADFLLENMMASDGRLIHCWNPGKTQINGFLEDYAFMAEGLISMYQATFDENYLGKALILAEYAIHHFYNAENGLFYITSDLDPELIARKQDIYDNVIPSSNSAMAQALHLLSLAYEREDLREIPGRMIAAVKERMARYPSSFANWACLAIENIYPFYTVAITGPGCHEIAASLRKNYFPSLFICGSETRSELPVLRDRFVEDQAMIYVCTGNECKLPTASVETALNYFSQISTDQNRR
jgi:uncharacterized protein YyaL (SSP411 family)